MPRWAAGWVVRGAPRALDSMVKNCRTLALSFRFFLRPAAGPTPEGAPGPVVRARGVWRCEIQGAEPYGKTRGSSRPGSHSPEAGSASGDEALGARRGLGTAEAAGRRGTAEGTGPAERGGNAVASAVAGARRGAPLGDAGTIGSAGARIASATAGSAFGSTAPRFGSAPRSLAACDVLRAMNAALARNAASRVERIEKTAPAPSTTKVVATRLTLPQCLSTRGSGVVGSETGGGVRGWMTGAAVCVGTSSPDVTASI
jgi:hypothetical protein